MDGLNARRPTSMRLAQRRQAAAFHSVRLSFRSQAIPAGTRLGAVQRQSFRQSRQYGLDPFRFPLADELDGDVIAELFLANDPAHLQDRPHRLRVDARHNVAGLQAGPLRSASAHDAGHDAALRTAVAVDAEPRGGRVGRMLASSKAVPIAFTDECMRMGARSVFRHW